MSAGWYKTIKQEQLDSLYAFNPKILADKLRRLYHKPFLFKHLNEYAQIYYESHRSSIETENDLNKFMVGNSIKIDIYYKKELNKLNYKECCDINSLIRIFTLTENDIYNPNARPNFDKDSFNRVLLFSRNNLY